jgi:hypothetical protein
MFNAVRTAQNNTISPSYLIVNTGTSTINLSDVKLRYYYTIDGEKTQSFSNDYCNASNATVTGTFVKMATPKTGADYYLEVGFSGTGTLAPGANVNVYVRFYKSDWSNYTQTGDYSFNATSIDFADSSKVSAYIAGVLKWGTEP